MKLHMVKQVGKLTIFLLSFVSCSVNFDDFEKSIKMNIENNSAEVQCSDGDVILSYFHSGDKKKEHLLLQSDGGVYFYSNEYSDCYCSIYSPDRFSDLINSVKELRRQKLKREYIAESVPYVEIDDFRYFSDGDIFIRYVNHKMHSVFSDARGHLLAIENYKNWKRCEDVPSSVEKYVEKFQGSKLPPFPPMQ